MVVYWQNLDPEIERKIKEAFNNILIPDGTTIVVDPITREIKAQVADMTGVVRTVNRREPDADGNVNTGFKIIDPMPMNLSPSEYPEGNSEFVDASGAGGWTDLMEISAESTQRVFVKTYIDRENSIYLQEIDTNEDGVFEPDIYRSSTDGLSWNIVKRAVRVKTINGIAPDDNYNVTIPIKPQWEDF